MRFSALRLFSAANELANFCRAALFLPPPPSARFADGDGGNDGNGELEPPIPVSAEAIGPKSSNSIVSTGNNLLLFKRDTRLAVSDFGGG